jgi:hypothetical protein
MKKFWIMLVVIFSLSSLVFAQNQTEGNNKIEVFTGYSGAALFTGDDFEPIENGFNVAAVYNIRRYIGIKVDTSGTYKKVEGNFYSATSTPIPFSSWKADHSLYNASVGVQFKDNSREAVVKPFAHILVGYGKHFDKFKTPCPTGAKCPPFNVDFEGVSLVIGGGLDIKVNRRIDIRVIQFDLNPIYYKANDPNRPWDLKRSWDNTRFSSGIVFKF